MKRIHVEELIPIDFNALNGKTDRKNKLKLTLCYLNFKLEFKLLYQVTRNLLQHQICSNV